MKKKITMMGIALGLGAGLTWGIDSSVLGIVGTDKKLADIAAKALVFAFATTFIHDAFSAVWMWIYMALKGNAIGTLKKLKTRDGKYVVLGALLGGPVGMTGYVLAINNIGVSYTTTISALFPAVGAFFAYIFLRDKLSLFNWIGLIISITCVILLGGQLSLDGENVVLGLIFAILCVLGWSLESTVCAYGMKDDVITPEEGILVRQTTSALTFGVILIPIFSSHSYTLDIMQSNSIWYLLGAAFFGTVSYVMYYMSINSIGPIRATSTNITYVAWAIVFSLVFLDGEFSVKSMILSFFIIVGSIMTVIKKEKVEVN